MFAILFAVFFVVNLSFAQDPVVTEEHVGDAGMEEYKIMKSNSDKHSFGVEVNENRQFHHTTTEEDGVRLGCYGHVHEGQNFATRYVADARGYRVVPYADLISVYPKSGSERQAAFSRDLRPDQVERYNVAFFFPEGCVAKEEKHISVPKVKININIRKNNNKIDLDDVKGSGSDDSPVRIEVPTSTSTTSSPPTDDGTCSFCSNNNNDIDFDDWSSGSSDSPVGIDETSPPPSTTAAPPSTSTTIIPKMNVIPAMPDNNTCSVRVPKCVCTCT